MIDFRALRLAVPAAVLLAGSGGAFAQTSTADQANTPPETPAVSTAPLPATQASDGPGADVVVNSLDTIDGPAVGLLDETNGSLGADMWSGASRGDLESELARIPAASTDPTVRGLAWRILLTPAETPVGPGHRALITIRLQRLLEAGFIDEAGALAAKATLPNDEDFALVQATALLYAQRDADLCGDRTATRLSNADPFWLQLRTYCYVTSGDAAAADLTRSVIAARGNADALFDALIDELAQGKHDAPGVTAAHPTAVDVFLLRKLGLPVTAQVAAPLDTAANLLAARDARNSPGDRLACAERIVSTGALGGDELRAIAKTQPFGTSTITPAPSFLGRQIALHHEAELASPPGAKLALIMGSDPVLNGSGDIHVFAALQADNVASVPAAPKPQETAWVAARTLILAGRTDAAAGWIGEPDNPMTAQAGIALDIVAPTPARDAAAQDDIAWFVDHADAEKGWPASSALALGIWTALGRTLPPDAQALQAALATQGFDGVQMTADQQQQLDDAASRTDRRGEAALLVLDAIGTQRISELSPQMSVHLVEALEKAGLDREARALAAEMLLTGPPAPKAVPVAAAAP